MSPAAGRKHPCAWFPNLVPPFSFPTEALASVESGGQASAAAESIDIDEIADKIDDNEESVLLLFDDDAQKKPAAATSTAAAVPEQKGTEDEIANLLNAVLPPTENDQSHAALLDALMPAGQPQEQPQPESGATASQPTATTAADAEQELAEWRAKVDKFQDDLKKRIRDGATEETIEEDVINFITAEGGGVQDEDEEDEVDWESRLQDVPGLDQDNEGGFKGECHYLSQCFLFSEYVLCCSHITHHTSHTHHTTVTGGREVCSAHAALHLEQLLTATLFPLFQEAMQRSREREARLHKLQEHVKVSAPWWSCVRCARNATHTVGLVCRTGAFR